MGLRHGTGPFNGALRMKNIRTFVIIPSLPESLEPLRKLAYNLWWSWNPQARHLFRRLDPDLYDAVQHNPAAMLLRCSQKRLEAAAADPAYVALLGRVANEFEAYMSVEPWFETHHPDQKNETIAYFSAEFGLHECLPIYSGGLGILAGDHLKAASDLGIPLVGVGLMYRQGYFQQQLTEDGWQLESYPAYDFHQWPVASVHDDAGRPVRVAVPLGGCELHAQVWVVHVGRVRLYLLDADIPENPPELRSVTARLYGGDSEMRVRQEILLAIGGLRALRALNISPTVCHMNEGHAAFLALERVRQLMRDHSLSYDEAREAATSGNLFTTHTAVPAGIDRFDTALVERELGWIAGELGISTADLIALGRESEEQSDGKFCMPILALRMAFRSNAVSEMHGTIARRMWQHCWPEVPCDEIPITHITNGIHTRTWLSRTMAELFDQYLGTGWAENPDHPDIWRRVEAIPDAELWRVHERRRERLIEIVRRRLREQLKGRGAPPAEIKAAGEVLDPKALTIGFARRFAPYKRATLLFRDLERLRALLANEDHPVQFIFAGKAHPADGAGKELIKQVAAGCKTPEFRRHIVFLENYDFSLGRDMVQGVDLWLNNPLAMHEASGTSGMKVPANGGLNLSCLDGWWPEAFNGDNGWAIGDGRSYDDLAFQDHVESESLYNLLEREIVPLFYRRTETDLPRKWIARVKQSMMSICPVFNTARMLKEYAEKMYVPALRRHRHLAADDYAAARSLTAWKQRLGGDWHQVRIARVGEVDGAVLKVGGALPLEAYVHLGSIAPDDVVVEIYHGPVGAAGEITAGETVAMQHAGCESNGEHLFKGAVPCCTSGRHGYAVRVLPNHPDLADRNVLGLVRWG